MKFVLDTNCYIAYAAGEKQIVAAMADFGEEFFFPAVVLGELCRGFLKGTKREYNEMKLHQIIRQLRIGIIDVTADVARKYALIYHSLANRGQKIPLNDVWIAASCMEVGGVLLTLDKHFHAVEQIEMFPL